MTDQLTNRFFDFIESSPTALHTVNAARALLLHAGFAELSEREPWELEAGKGYFTTRSMGSILAFRCPKKDFRTFSIAAPHGDSPCFQVKGAPEMKAGDGKYTKLNTEVYGGMALNLWLDRPLSVAGRLAIRTEEGLRMQLVDLHRDLLVIPSLAIHMNREANNGSKVDPQRDT
ncbi:MAG: M18 family aminopeptidase, partial [Acutalibacter sp.]|nr:M18 family aminopeptidase [Acutalibacter sp.]